MIHDRGMTGLYISKDLSSSKDWKGSFRWKVEAKKAGKNRSLPACQWWRRWKIAFRSADKRKVKPVEGCSEAFEGDGSRDFTLNDWINVQRRIRMVYPWRSSLIKRAARNKRRKPKLSNVFYRKEIKRSRSSRFQSCTLCFCGPATTGTFAFPLNWKNRIFR